MKVIDESRRKKKKKSEFGWFYQLSPGNPEYNMDAFNHSMDVGSVPTSGSMSESVNLNPLPENCIIQEVPQFKKQFKKLGLDSEDLEELKYHLKHVQPKANLGSGLKKVEWTPKKLKLAKGEERVIYLELVNPNTAFLITIYSKNKKSNLTSKELSSLRKLAKTIKLKVGDN